MGVHPATMALLEFLAVGTQEIVKSSAIIQGISVAPCRGAWIEMEAMA